jgi:membrane associated rhomboid family serine protease
MQFTITLVITLATVIVSIGAFNNQKLVDDLIFYPPAITRRNQWYRFITHGFIHADAIHLIFNMLAFYSFGENVETLFGIYLGPMGKLFYVLLYFSALIVASIPDFIKYRNSYHYRSLGASGAVSAIIFASILFFPTGRVSFFFIPIPGYIFAVVYLIISSVLAKRGQDNIGHTAHITGAIYGLLFTYIVVTAFTDYDLLKMFIEQIRGN